MAYFNDNQNSFPETAGNGPYQDQLLHSDEKFSVWLTKSFSERQSAFKKVSFGSRSCEDQLSYWVNEQMDILLAKSVMG